MGETEFAVQDGRVLLDPGVLKSLRKTQGHSQETLAYACLDKHLCVSVASIKRAETGKPVLYRTARHLANMFGVEIDTLIGKAGASVARQARSVGPISPVRRDSGGTPREEVIRFIVVLRFAPLPEAPVEQLTALIRQFGGQVRFAPSVTACFGMSHAYGSDSRRALLCAMALLRARWVDEHRPVVLELQRSGDTLGGSMPRERFASNLGEPVVHVAQALVEQLSAWFEFAEAEQAAPGYRACRRVREPGESASRGLAGRSIEVLQFDAVLDAVRECQDGHVVYVRGMAGIGKTRLLETFRDMARREGFLCHDGEFHDFGVDSGATLLAHLVCSVAGMPAGSEHGRASLTPAITAAFRTLKVPEPSLVFLQALLAGTPDDAVQRARYAAMNDRERRDGLQAAICHLLLRQAIRKPLLIAIEDVHWGDAQTLALLARLMAATSDAPIVWVLTSRREGDPLDATLRPNFPAALSVLDLAPLRPREAVSLASHFTGVDPAYRAACIERAQGNPLYLTQLLANHESEFPDSLRHLVQTRVDRLSPAARNALRCAAVFGHRFELASLRGVLGDIGYVPEQEVRQMMVKEVDAGTYAFVHDLVMQCIYESIPIAARARLHGAVAQWYEATDLALHAQHLVRAGDARAGRALLTAMRERLGDYHHAQALDLGALGEGCTADAAERRELALLRGQAYAGLGRLNEACECFWSALELAASPALHIEAVLCLAPVLNALDRLEEEDRLLEEALPLAHAIRADVELARLLQLRGNIRFPQGDYVLCRQLHREALRHARRARHVHSEVQALSGIADSYYAQGRMGRAHALFDRCVQGCRTDGMEHAAAGNLAARGSTASYLGRCEQALLDSEDAIARSVRIGNRRAEVFARLTEAWVLADAGRDEQAQVAVEQALALARQIGTSRFEPMLLELSARLALRRGDDDEAWQWIMQAAALVDQLRLHRYIGAWVQGSIALIAPDPALRERALVEGAALLTERCLAHNALRFHLAAAELALLERQPGRAMQHAGHLRAVAPREPYAWIEHHAQLIEQGAQWLASGSAEIPRGLIEVRQAGIGSGFVATMPKWMVVISG